jgi:hypothetical protein
MVLAEFVQLLTATERSDACVGESAARAARKSRTASDNCARHAAVCLLVRVRLRAIRDISASLEVVLIAREKVCRLLDGNGDALALAVDEIDSVAH